MLGAGPARYRSVMPTPEPRQILITGVTSGLGKALARRFASLGHSLAGCGRNADAIASLEREIGPGHQLTTLDVTDDAGVASWARTLAEAGWVPDLLINNAGVLNRRAPLWEIDAAAFDQVIDVNVKGVANVVRAFVPAMIASRTGVIVNLSSGWGTQTSPEVAPYCASKHAVEGLTGALAQELPEGLAAVPLSPGVVHTPMLDTAFGAEAATHWSPEEWIDVAAPYLLRLGPKDNGRSQRIPGS